MLELLSVICHITLLDWDYKNTGMDKDTDYGSIAFCHLQCLQKVLDIGNTRNASTSKDIDCDKMTYFSQKDPNTNNAIAHACLNSGNIVPNK